MNLDKSGLITIIKLAQKFGIADKIRFMRAVPDIQTELISYSPATGEPIGSVTIFTEDEVRMAVERSREVFHTWKASSFVERETLVLEAREIILAELDDIAELISAETGKPAVEAISMEIATVLDLMHYFAKNAKKLLKPKRLTIELYAFLGRR